MAELQKTLNLNPIQQRALKSALARQFSHLDELLKELGRNDTARGYLEADRQAITEIQAMFR